MVCWDRIFTGFKDNLGLFTPPFCEIVLENRGNFLGEHLFFAETVIFMQLMLFKSKPDRDEFLARKDEGFLLLLLFDFSPNFFSIFRFVGVNRGLRRRLPLLSGFLFLKTERRGVTTSSSPFPTVSKLNGDLILWDCNSDVFSSSSTGFLNTLLLILSPFKSLLLIFWMTLSFLLFEENCNLEV